MSVAPINLRALSAATATSPFAYRDDLEHKAFDTFFEATDSPKESSDGSGGVGRSAERSLIVGQGPVSVVPPDVPHAKLHGSSEASPLVAAALDAGPALAATSLQGSSAAPKLAAIPVAEAAYRTANEVPVPAVAKVRVPLSNDAGSERPGESARAAVNARGALEIYVRSVEDPESVETSWRDAGQRVARLIGRVLGRLILNGRDVLR